MTNPLLPWERFGTQAVEGAVGQVVGQVEGDITAATGIPLPNVGDMLPGAVIAPQPQEQPQPLPPTYEPPPAPAPVPPTPTSGSIDIKSVVEASLKEAVAAAVPAIKAQAMTYAKEELQATLSGEKIDQAHPTITVTTAKGKEMKVADAKNRSYRTFVMGLGTDVFFAVIALLGTLTTFDPFAKASWYTFLALVTKTVFQTVITYIARMKITPTTSIDGQTVSLVTVPATSVTTLTTPSHLV